MKRIMALFGITALAFFGMTSAETHTKVISFDNLPSGPFFSYGYDMDNDGTDDVVFRTDCVAGLKRADGPNPTPLSKIVFPGLQGKIRPGTNEHEVIVEFLTGAIGSISFDFVVGSASDTYESYVQVYGTGQNDRWVATAQASGTPAEHFLTISIPSVAQKAVIDFNSGKGSVFIMDNFNITRAGSQRPPT